MISINLYFHDGSGIFIACHADINPLAELGIDPDDFYVSKIETSQLESEPGLFFDGKKLRRILFISSPPGLVARIKNKLPGIKIQSAELSDLLTAKARKETLDFLTDFGANIITKRAPELIKPAQDKMLYRGECADFFILGKIGSDPSSLNITLKMVFSCGKLRVGPLNLYSPADRGELTTFAVLQGYQAGLFESDLMILLDLVEKEREAASFPGTNLSRPLRKLHSHEREKELTAYLGSGNLIQKITSKLTEAGLPGEDRSKLICFLALLSARQENPLHVILCGSPGSGKSHLIHTLADCLPEEDGLKITRLSSKSFYYMKDTGLHQKMVFIEDMDGLSADSLFAFRELQSAKSVSVFRPYADSETGSMKTRMHRINASFASIAATTRGEIYPDNLSRSILLSMDESDVQIKRILDYQNRRRAGFISPDTEVDAKHFLRDVLLLLREFEVVNPFACEIDISETGFADTRLNGQFLDIVEQITLLHQFGREKDAEGRLISNAADIKEAAALFAGIICTKTDLLNPAQRRFFERLKTLASSEGEAKRFMQREVRQQFRLSKSQTQELFSDLRSLGYIRVAGGTANKGFLYEIAECDEFQERRNKIIRVLTSQAEKIK